MDLDSLTFSRPTTCSACGSMNLDYKGIGEYECADCHHKQYDDYGKVRNFLEKNRGATQAQISQATGVSLGRIRQFLREEKFEVANGSAVFLHCERCGAQIKSGIYCDKCKIAMTKEVNSGSSHKNYSGFSAEKRNNSGGERRYI